MAGIGICYTHNKVCTETHIQSPELVSLLMSLARQAGLPKNINSRCLESEGFNDFLKAMISDPYSNQNSFDQ